jgi:hypothetical protein
MNEAHALGTTTVMDTVRLPLPSMRPVHPDADGTRPRTLQQVAADRREGNWDRARLPSTGTAGDGIRDARIFRQALAKWARGYSLRYRHGIGPKPSLADARQDLRRWSSRYWDTDPGT